MATDEDKEKARHAHLAAKPRKRRAKDPERVRAEDRAHYRRNAPKRRAAQRLRDQRKKAADPERFLADNRRWRDNRIAADPELHRIKCNAYDNQRRARELAAPGRGVTLDQWRQVLVEALGLCAYCNECKKLTMDHIEPITRGGDHDIDNIAAACDRCNKSKSNDPLLVWLAKKATKRTGAWVWFEDAA